MNHGISLCNLFEIAREEEYTEYETRYSLCVWG